MNNKQLDMVLGYLNEGTEIDEIEWLMESINETINQFEFVNEDVEILNEGKVADKIKSVLHKIAEFIKSAFNKIKSLMDSLISKLMQYIQKAKNKLKEKKAMKEAAEMIQIPYYVIRNNGESMSAEVGDFKKEIAEVLSSVNAFMDDVADSIVYAIENDNFSAKDADIADNSATLTDKYLYEVEIKFRDKSYEDAFSAKIDIASKLVQDAKALKDAVAKSTKLSDQAIGKIAAKANAANEESASKLNSYINIFQKIAAIQNRCALEASKSIAHVASSYLKVGSLED